MKENINKENIKIIDLHGIETNKITKYLEKKIEEYQHKEINPKIVIYGLKSNNKKNLIYKYLKEKNIEYEELDKNIIIIQINNDVKKININEYSNYNIIYPENAFGMTNILDFLKNNYEKIYQGYEQSILIKKIKIKNLYGLFNYNVSFENNNVFVIHAPNGCGKSSFLNYIKQVINKEIDNLYKSPFEYIEFEVEKNLNENTKLNNFLLEIKLKQEVKNIKIEPYKKPKKITDKMPECNYISHDILYKYKFENKGIITEQKVKYFQEIMDEYFCYEKKVTLDNKKNKEDKIIIEYNYDTIYRNPSIFKKHDKIKFCLLSSGEQYIIKLFYKLLFDLKYNSFAIIDEPEIFLHVEWQEMLINTITKIAKEFEIYILIASHSPYIVNNPHIKAGVVEYEN